MAICKVGFRAGARMIAQGGAREVLTKAGVAKLTGSVSRSAVRSWAGRKGLAETGDILHHWFFAANSKIGKLIPDVIKNQPWNYLKISDRSIKGLLARAAHESLHGWGSTPFNMAEKLLYGTPAWAKGFTASTIGHGVSHFGPGR